jgi:cytochrome b6-f complex iron-sulfur subunit
MNNNTQKHRRQFLAYLVSGTTGSIILGLLFPEISKSQEEDNLESLCSSFPYNSRCRDYLPGVLAVDSQGNAIQPNSLLTNAIPGVPIPVQGLPKTTYLVIQEGPKIASYAISPVCTHLGCTVEWKAESNRFICPCHGSQYSSTGKVEKGPANKHLPLVTVVIKQNQIRLLSQETVTNPPD